MGFPVQIYGAAVLPKVLILAAAIFLSTLAYSLVCWLSGLFRCLDANEGLYISSLSSQLASIYGHDDDGGEDDDDDDDDGGDDMSSPASSCTHQDMSASLDATPNLEELPDPAADLVEDDASTHCGNCCVCLCLIRPSSGKQLPRCAHILHSACLDTWLQHAHMKVCPVCRAPTSVE